MCCCVLGFASRAVAVPVVVEVTVDPLSPRDLDELQTVRFGYDTDAELLWDGVKDPLGIFGDDSPNLRHHYRGDWAEWVEPDGDLRRLTTDLEIQIANDFRSQGDYFRIKSTIENMELGITDDFATKGLITTLDLGEVTESLTLENAAGAGMQWGGSPHLSGLVTDMRITIVPEPSSITLAAFCSFVMCMVKRRIRPVAVCLLIAMAVTSRAVAVPVVMEVTVDSSFSETLTGLQTVYFGWDTDAELLWDGVKDPAGVLGDNPPNTNPCLSWRLR